MISISILSHGQSSWGAVAAFPEGVMNHISFSQRTEAVPLAGISVPSRKAVFRSAVARLQLTGSSSRIDIPSKIVGSGADLNFGPCPLTRVSAPRRLGAVTKCHRTMPAAGVGEALLTRQD